MTSTGPPAHSYRGVVRTVSGHLLPACASASLLSLAYPMPGWGFLAHVALVPWIVLAIRSASPKRLAWTSYLVMLAWCLIMYRWLYPVTGGGYVAVSFYMAIYFTAPILLTRWLHRRLGSAMVLTLPLAWVTCEYARCHFIEGGFPWFALGHTQAPFNPVASGDPGSSPGRLMQIADLFGQHGVSFLVAMTNGVIVDLLTRPLIRRDATPAPNNAPPARGRASRYLQAAVLLWFASFVSAWFYGHYRLTTAPPSPRYVRIAVVQTNVPQSNKMLAENSGKLSAAEMRDLRIKIMVEDWKRLVDLTMSAGTQPPPPDLIVWPETVVPAALNDEAVKYHAENYAYGARFDYSSFHRQIGELAKRLEVPLLVGSSAEYDYTPTPMGNSIVMFPAKRFNSAFFYHTDGTQDEQRYDKVHRVPFGEYRPWVEGNPKLDALFLKYLTPYDFDYSIKAGTRFTVFELEKPASSTGAPATQTQPGTTAPATSSLKSPSAGAATLPAVRFATPICFEDVTPAVTRAMVYDGEGHKRADLLINITNDGWYPGSDQGVQHLQIATLRCVELRVPMARAVNTGVSAFIDADGRIVAQVEEKGQRQLVEGFAVQDVRLDGRETLYGRIGDWPIYGLMTLTGGLAVGALLVKRK